MLSATVRQPRRLAFCLLIILVLASGSVLNRHADAQVPTGHSDQPEQGNGYEKESAGNLRFDRMAAPAAVPPGIVGVWKGTIRTDPALGDYTFSALLSVVDGANGEVVGTSAHPSEKCGGEMRLQNATSDTVIASTDYTFGRCLDGNHRLRLSNDGTLDYEWHDPHSARVDRGALTKVDGGGTAMPREYAGVWKGTAHQTNPDVQWSVLISLVNGSVGSIVGTYASPTSECGGELPLLSVNDDSVELLHDITYGSCWDNGVDTLRLAADDTLEYHWRSPDDTSTASGTLVRISGSPSQTCTLPSFGDSSGNPLRQNVGAWASKPYGGTDYKHNGQTRFLPFIHFGNQKDTIARWGCYLTSAAMIVNYYAEQQGISFRTDPGLLNDWLQHHDGYSTGDPLPSEDNPQYVGSSLVRPHKVVEYANAEIQMAYIGTDRRDTAKETAEEFIARTQPNVNASICALDSLIMGVTSSYGQHYVAVTGTQVESNVDTWRIHDPSASTPTALNTAYDNEYNQTVSFSGNRPDRVLSITNHSAAAMVVIDSEGRRTGYEPRTGTTYHNIPGSSYGVDRLATIDGSGGLLEQTALEIATATLGEYVLQTIGTSSGPYALEIMATNDLGEGTLTRLGGEAFTGQVDTYSVSYSSSAGQPIQISKVRTTIYLPIIVR